MIWNQDLLYQIIDVWYHIRKLYLINNEKNDKIKLNNFFHKRRPIDSLLKLHFSMYAFMFIFETENRIKLSSHNKGQINYLISFLFKTPITSWFLMLHEKNRLKFSLQH